MPTFSNDWFAPNIPTFNRFLNPLKDRPCNLLEIGTYEGRATLWLHDNIATHPDSTIDTIDSMESDILKNNFAGRPHIYFHCGYSDDILRTLPVHHYDFIYVDGCHSAPNVIEDAILSFRLLRDDGILAFDDYLWDDPSYPNREGRPKLAIDAFLKIYAKRLKLLHRGRQVWLRKRAVAVNNDMLQYASTYRTPSLLWRATQRVRVARMELLGF